MYIPIPFPADRYFKKFPQHQNVFADYKGKDPESLKSMAKFKTHTTKVVSKMLEVIEKSGDSGAFQSQCTAVAKMPQHKGLNQQQFAVSRLHMAHTRTRTRADRQTDEHNKYVGCTRVDAHAYERKRTDRLSQPITPTRAHTQKSRKSQKLNVIAIEGLLLSTRFLISHSPLLFIWGKPTRWRFSLCQNGVNSP